MDWKELLKNFRLIDFQLKIKDMFKGQQIGLFNRIENYNLVMPQDVLEKLIDERITPAIEKAAKERAFKTLEPLSSVLDLLPESTTTAVIASTMTTETIQIHLSASATISDNVTIKINDEST